MKRRFDPCYGAMNGLFARRELFESAPPCLPTVLTTIGGRRLFTIRVYRRGPTTVDDAAESTELIGAFRAAVRRPV